MKNLLFPGIYWCTDRNKQITRELNRHSKTGPNWAFRNTSTNLKFSLCFSNISSWWLLFFQILWNLNEKSYKLGTISKIKASLEKNYMNENFIKLNFTCDHQISNKFGRHFFSEMSWPPKVPDTLMLFISQVLTLRKIFEISLGYIC